MVHKQKPSNSTSLHFLSRESGLLITPDGWGGQRVSSKTRYDRECARVPSPANRAALSVEVSQIHGPVLRPAGGQPSRILGAVGVPNHDLLPTSLEAPQVGRYVEQLLHRGGRSVEVIQILEAGYYVQWPLDAGVMLEKEHRLKRMRHMAKESQAMHTNEHDTGVCAGHGEERLPPMVDFIKELISTEELVVISRAFAHLPGGGQHGRGPPAVPSPEDGHHKRGRQGLPGHTPGAQARFIAGILSQFLNSTGKTARWC